MTDAPATKRNREPILDVLKQYITKDKRLLEIGSGTGEHAVFFAKNFEKLHWVTSDIRDNHDVIKRNVQMAKQKNVHGPETLMIGKDDFPSSRPFDYVFSANTLHIMSWKESKTLFKLLGKRLREKSLVFFYGPFNYDGKFTSASNEEFNQWLKNRDEKSGIRNFEDVLTLMEKSGHKLIKDHEMPANNRLLVFERLAFNG